MGRKESDDLDSIAAGVTGIFIYHGLRAMNVID